MGHRGTNGGCDSRERKGDGVVLTCQVQVLWGIKQANIQGAGKTDSEDRNSLRIKGQKISSSLLKGKKFLIQKTAFTGAEPSNANKY